MSSSFRFFIRHSIWKLKAENGHAIYQGHTAGFLCEGIFRTHVGLGMDGLMGRSFASLKVLSFPTDVQHNLLSSNHLRVRYQAAIFLFSAKTTKQPSKLQQLLCVHSSVYVYSRKAYLLSLCSPSYFFETGSLTEPGTLCFS